MSSPSLTDLEVVWPTRSRTGSQFVLSLTTAVFGDLTPQSRINGARREAYRIEEKKGNFWEMYQKGSGYQYLADNHIRSLKFEDPGKDDFAEGLLELAPNARFVASYRPIEAVIESHFNIETWGHTESNVLYEFSACLTLYERLAAAGRLFLVNVEEKEQFNLEAFVRFLGRSLPSERTLALVDEWKPINTLRDQVEKHGSNYRGRKSAPRLERLRQIHDWASGYEERYQLLCESSSHS